MTKPRDYCPFTHVALESRTSALVLANIALTADTYAEMKQLLRKHDTTIGPPCNFARFVEPACEVFEMSKGEWIPMRYLHKLAATFLDKHC